MGFIAIIGNAIWAKFEPLLSARLDRLEESTGERLDELQAAAMKQLDEWRDDAMKMLGEALPEMASAVAESTVKTVFDHTQIDEAANSVSGVIADIFNRFPKLR